MIAYIWWLVPNRYSYCRTRVLVPFFFFFYSAPKAGEGCICIIAAREFSVRRVIGVEIEEHLVEQVRFGPQCTLWNHT